MPERLTPRSAVRSLLLPEFRSDEPLNQVGVTDYVPDAERKRWLSRITSGPNAAIIAAVAFVFWLGPQYGLFDFLLPFVFAWCHLLRDFLLFLETGAGSAPVAAFVEAAGRINGWLVGGVLFCGFYLWGLVRAYVQPTHVSWTDRGLFVLSRAARGMSGVVDSIDWHDVQAVELRRPRGARSASRCRIVLRAANRRISLCVGDLVEPGGLDRLVAAIKERVPAGKMARELVEFTDPPAIQESYTELWLKEWAAPPQRRSLKPLDAGRELDGGRYRILEKLGGGGQGTVYLAAVSGQARLAGDLPEVVALKEFVLPVFPDPEVRRKAAARFQSEADLLARIEHPAIVRMLDVFVEDHRAYLVLERASGRTLRALVRECGALEEKEVLSLARQMCDILIYLHGLAPPVVHRDFAPDNLMVCREGNLKLIDFSVATQQAETVTGTVVGKPNYVPPEQFRGKPVTQSDIYALGATLYFLLTAREPEAISAQHPRQAAAGVSERLDAIVARATAPAAAERYVSAEDLRAELDRCAAELS